MVDTELIFLSVSSSTQTAIFSVWYGVDGVVLYGSGQKRSDTFDNEMGRYIYSIPTKFMCSSTCIPLSISYFNLPLAFVFSAPFFRHIHTIPLISLVCGLLFFSLSLVASPMFLTDVICTFGRLHWFTCDWLNSMGVLSNDPVFLPISLNLSLAWIYVFSRYVVGKKR